MTNDLIRRFELLDASTQVWRIALTMEQIEKYNPPPNFAKLSDSRAGVYIEQFGTDSWELDALEPSVISELIKDTTLLFRDESRWDDTIARERDMRYELSKVLKHFENEQ